MPACAKSHGARLLANQTRCIGLFGVRSTGSASHQVDAIANSLGLLKIEGVCSSFHVTLKIIDGLAHNRSMHENGSQRHCPNRIWSVADSESLPEPAICPTCSGWLAAVKPASAMGAFAQLLRYCSPAKQIIG